MKLLAAFTTANVIRLTIVLTWTMIALAGCDVARFYDLVVQGWPALAALLGIMIGGKTMERVKELNVRAPGQGVLSADGGLEIRARGASQ